MVKEILCSPFAPATVPQMPVIGGVRFAAVEAGIKYQNRKDLLLAVVDEGTVVGGVLTKSKTRSAPVLWCLEQLAHGRARALVVNAGNANAFTGQRGDATVKLTAKSAAEAVGCPTEEVYLASTGVIGEPLEAADFAHRLSDMADNLSPHAWADAASSIMTTDTFPKMASTSIGQGKETIQIAGIAKGSGMIAPNMATMLSFIFTDAKISQSILQDLTARAASKTFNCITVDSDTSTSDTLLVFATGASAASVIASETHISEFGAALHDVMQDLAFQVVRDGEGISKFITIRVTGAENNEAAHRIAMAMGNSPLLKTAIAGEDANWGRVVMAVGKAGEQADRDRLRIQFGPYLLANDGERVSDYREDLVSDYMKNDEIKIEVDVGIASGSATIWTCDLTHGYISINADYRS
ncbi:MAG: bifunctional glutamate N-acetyltransferase/amino-acid acetyltransferase ArgJ [Hyphomicrobiaceae bacterium]